MSELRVRVLEFVRFHKADGASITAEALEQFVDAELEQYRSSMPPLERIALALERTAAATERNTAVTERMLPTMGAIEEGVKEQTSIAREDRLPASADDVWLRFAKEFVAACNEIVAVEAAKPAGGRLSNDEVVERAAALAAERLRVVH